MDKSATTSSPIHSLLANRWSPCAFDESATVPVAARTAMLEAARWAPSCYGAQPWFFVVCDKHTHADAWRKLLNCLGETNQQWAQRAPLLILVCADTRFPANDEVNRHHAYDSGAAAVSLVLEAENQGFRSHQMGGFDADAARNAFQVPARCDCFSVIAVGKQGAAESLPDNLQRRDAAPRQRLPLDEKFFLGAWGTTD